MNRNFQISKETFDKVKLAKKYIQTRYQKIIQDESLHKLHWINIKASIDTTTSSFNLITQQIHQKQNINKRLQRQKDSLDNYRLYQIIGRGAFGEVRLAQNKATNQIVAIKRLEKSKLLQKKQIYNAYLERDFMVNGLSSFLVQLASAFQDQNYLYIAMQYIPGGNLLHLLIEKDMLTEDQTRFYIAEMILAVQQIHKMNYIHRDIKPDNILLDQYGHIKISDFGLSKYLEKKETKDKKYKLSKMDQIKKLNRLKTREKMFSKVGTPDYISPEVLTDNTYDHSIDIWAVGVIMFECIFGYPPFTDDDSKQVCHRVINWVNYLQFPDDVQASTAAKMLILGMVNQKSKRLTISQIKQHPYFSKINWGNIHKTKAPNIPKLKTPLDVSNFDQFRIQEPWSSSDQYSNCQQKRIVFNSPFKFAGFDYKPLPQDPLITTIKSLQKIQSMKSVSKQKIKKKTMKRLQTQQCQRGETRSSKQKTRYSIKSLQKQKQQLKKLKNQIKGRCSVRDNQPQNRSIQKQYSFASQMVNAYKMKPFKKMTKVKIEKVKEVYGCKLWNQTHK